MTPSAPFPIEGVKQKAPYGTDLPVLIYTCSDCGFSMDSWHPIHFCVKCKRHGTMSASNPLTDGKTSSSASKDRECETGNTSQPGQKMAPVTAGETAQSDGGGVEGHASRTLGLLPKSPSTHQSVPVVISLESPSGLGRLCTAEVSMTSDSSALAVPADGHGERAEIRSVMPRLNSVGVQPSTSPDSAKASPESLARGASVSVGNSSRPSYEQVRMGDNLETCTNPACGFRGIQPHEVKCPFCGRRTSKLGE